MLNTFCFVVVVECGFKINFNLRVYELFIYGIRYDFKIKTGKTPFYNLVIYLIIKECFTS